MWTYRNPVDLHFGNGVIEQIGRVVAGRRYLLVTHPDAPIARWRDRVVALAGDPVAIADEVEPNPSLEMLARMCSRLSTIADRVEVVVALGGGSVIDSAKFLAAGHLVFKPVRDYLEHAQPLPGKALSLIAIPTTAGTGSDLTKWATIWDPQTDRKLSLNSDDLYAKSALVDPDITTSLPWGLTLASGLDALSHALESIWNVNANPVTRNFAVAAARDVLSALPALQVDLTDPGARTTLARGATFAGLAFSNTQTALAHNISYPITLRHGVIHGIACSFCLPEVMTAAIGAAEECDAALADIFGAVEAAPHRLRAFLSSLGVPQDHAALGIEEAEWQSIVTSAFSGPRGRNFIGRADRFSFRDRHPAANSEKK
ncbi:MAG: iron-containing alcohol dehydrogenase [Hyphomicrobiales bacterium]|nr:MAG: iron-containing alcohol dehydrogenase [Hyphomicrobiales bacterium]